ncbi:MAG: bifunctional nuclease family protein [Bdellovibrionales bacterium]|nr:bifunctional nuclease family protein [Bdellovibrionales bacterium]
MIELEPFGMTAGMDKQRPVMLFREKGGEATLPVWLSPLDAGIALTQHNVQAFAMSPHDVTLKVLEQLGVQVVSCRFCEVKGHQQYVELKFSGSRKLKPMRFRADHAVSFCLQARVKFYCTREYLETCREVDAAIERLQSSLNMKPGVRRNGHPYLN